MKEIGSEFWDIPICDKRNSIFPADTQWFISGRSALKAIVAEGCFKSVGIPIWCCDSIIKPFLESDIEVKFYDDNMPTTDAVLVMDFFGYTRQKSWEGYNGVVIRDITHSIFSTSYSDADYYFGSLRKWAGFWTGGYAWGFKKPVTYEGECSTYFEMRRKAMDEKRSFINRTPMDDGRIVCDKGYLELFYRLEEGLENIEICPAALRDIELAQLLDVEYLRARRRENALVLLDAFSDIAIFPDLNEADCPLFVPIRVDNRDELRRHLIRHEIFCPIHWPISTNHRLTTKGKKLYDQELSLVCDQRYDRDDMERIVGTIKEFRKDYY